jgi:SPOR domain
MKWLFGLLLLASLAFFAFMQWSGSGAGEGKNAQSQPPLNAEKIKLLPASVSAASAVQPAAQPASACMEWGGFSGSDLARATAALSGLKLGNKLTQRQVEHISGYWVYLPPLKTHAEVEAKVAQLKTLGVEEYFAIQETGKWQNAISLGVFRTEEAAHKFLESIKAKGLKSATAGERMSKNMLTAFVLKDPDAELTAKMATLQKDFPDSELKAVACAN